MPQNKFALARYRLIDEILRRQECAKTMEIAEMCREKLGFKVTQRTIQLDMDAMKNDPFLGYFLPINYCNRRKAYYYDEKSVEIFLVLCLTEQELSFLQKLKDFLRDAIQDNDFNLYCSFLNKVMSYCKN